MTDLIAERREIIESIWHNNGHFAFIAQLLTESMNKESKTYFASLAPKITQFEIRARMVTDRINNEMERIR